MDEVMITTIDNPYDPFEQFANWFLFDVEKGYNTCARLGRLVQFTDDMTQQEMDAEEERVIDEIIKYDFLDLYKKVKRKQATA